MLGDAAVGKFAEQGEAEVFALAGFDEHEDPGAEDSNFHNAGSDAHGLGDVGEGGEDPVDEEPGDEEVQPLEGVKAGFAAVAEPFGGQHDDGDDPADQRDVAECGCPAVIQAGEGVFACPRRSWPRGGGPCPLLLRTTCGTESVRGLDLKTALCTERHF